jgi:hypothetical protein
MGFSVSWLAVSGKEEGLLLAELGLARTGERGAFAGSAIVGCGLAWGWYLIGAKRVDHWLVSESSLARVSSGCSAVACSIEEHVMFSAATLWRDGRRIWRVEHQSELGPAHLAVVGTPPDDFEEVRRHYEAEQAADEGAAMPVDFIFEIPLALASKLVGFKHDEATERFSIESFDDFEVLRDERQARPWWRFW